MWQTAQGVDNFSIQYSGYSMVCYSTLFIVSTRSFLRLYCAGGGGVAATCDSMPLFFMSFRYLFVWGCHESAMESYGRLSLDFHEESD